jgi:hypothetical protein
MNKYQEAILRGVGVFLSVFFTVGWAKRSPIPNDEEIAVVIILLAILTAHLTFK